MRPRSPLSFTLFPLVLAGCAAPHPAAEAPPGEKTRPEAPPPVEAAVPEPTSARSPQFSEAQKAQLALLGPVCTTAYHLDQTGQVDQVGCSAKEPSSTPVAAEYVSPYGNSWEGHFSTPTADELLIWFTDGTFRLSTRAEGKITTLLSRPRAFDARCTKLSGPGHVDLLACEGEFSTTAFAPPGHFHVLRFGERIQPNGFLNVVSVADFTGASGAEPWSGLCYDSLAVTYELKGLAAVKNSKTGADDLKVEIERKGWLTREMTAARKQNAETCKKVEEAAGLEVELPPVPSKVFTFLLPFPSLNSPDLAKLNKESEDEDARSMERDRKKGIAR
ncbi:MAG TPA: hypothetical protein VLC09_02780 [Polyangiaceae bacterium]|nr:hypothetical protein [Polyangiaceae bacterium]